MNELALQAVADGKPLIYGMDIVIPEGYSFDDIFVSKYGVVTGCTIRTAGGPTVFSPAHVEGTPYDFTAG